MFRKWFFEKMWLMKISNKFFSAHFVILSSKDGTRARVLKSRALRASKFRNALKILGARAPRSSALNKWMIDKNYKNYIKNYKIFLCMQIWITFLFYIACGEVQGKFVSEGGMGKRGLNKRGAGKHGFAGKNDWTNLSFFILPTVEPHSNLSARALRAPN